MSDTAVSLTNLITGTVSGDLIAATGTSVTTGNVAVVAAVGETDNIVMAFYSSAGGTATVAAGAEPPSERAGLGAGSAQTITGGTVMLLALPSGQHVQTNGTVRIGITGTVLVTAFVTPRGGGIVST